MRKSYVKPALNSEEFIPQVYCAVCSHTESGAGMYKFVCDAGGGDAGDIITDAGVNLTDGSLSYYHACQKTHEAPTTDEFTYGYFIKNGGNDKLTYKDGIFGITGNEIEYEKVRVIIWTGDGDIHATENLNRDTWEKNIS